MTMWCPNPYEWLDICWVWESHCKVAFACCSECWGTHEVCLTQQEIPEFVKSGQSILDFWNLPRMAAVRKEWFTGVPHMCAGCPRLKAREEPVLSVEALSDPWHKDVWDNKRTNTTPRVLNLAYDPTCNLSCRQCRRAPISIRPGDPRYEAMLRFQEEHIKPLMRKATMAFCAAYGDPFADSLYYRMLTELTPDECPNLKLYILTNGQGLSAERLERVPLKDRIVTVNVSVDAADAEAYKDIRGGNWDNLCRNLEMLSKRVADRKLGTLALSFVFQKRNFRQLHEFLRWAERLRATHVTVNLLLNHTRDCGYLDQAVHLPGHPDFREAVGILQSARAYDGKVKVYVEVPKE